MFEVKNKYKYTTHKVYSVHINQGNWKTEFLFFEDGKWYWDCAMNYVPVEI